jgi:hypothetical protein
MMCQQDDDLAEGLRPFTEAGVGTGSWGGSTTAQTTSLHCCQPRVSECACCHVSLILLAAVLNNLGSAGTEWQTQPSPPA